MRRNMGAAPATESAAAAAAATTPPCFGTRNQMGLIMVEGKENGNRRGAMARSNARGTIWARVCTC